MGCSNARTGYESIIGSFEEPVQSESPRHCVDGQARAYAEIRTGRRRSGRRGAGMFWSMYHQANPELGRDSRLPHGVRIWPMRGRHGYMSDGSAAAISLGLI